MARSTGLVSFHRLEFAGQLIVWAVRKRLHLLRSGADDSDVARAFHLGGLDALHTSLMTVIDVLVCGSPKIIQLHEVSCPCLAPYEVALLNAFAHLQEGRADEAKVCMVELLCRPALGLVMPAMDAIVRELAAHELKVLPVENPLEPRHALFRQPSQTLH